MNDSFDGSGPSAAGSMVSLFGYELVLSCCPGAISVSLGLSLYFGLLVIIGFRCYIANFWQVEPAFHLTSKNLVCHSDVGIHMFNAWPALQGVFGLKDVLGCIICIGDYSAQCMTNSAGSVLGPEVC